MSVGDARDVVDGGTKTKKDTLGVTGTAANFFVETVSGYNARIKPDYAGTAEILLSDSAGSISVKMTEIEEIFGRQALPMVWDYV